MKRDGASAMAEIPFRQWLEEATGVLGWKPAEFWAASLTEYFAAVKGWNRHQQGKTGKPPPLTRDELTELIAEDKARIERAKRRKAANG